MLAARDAKSDLRQFHQVVGMVEVESPIRPGSSVGRPWSVALWEAVFRILGSGRRSEMRSVVVRRSRFAAGSLEVDRNSAAGIAVGRTAVAADIPLGDIEAEDNRRGADILRIVVASDTAAAEAGIHTVVEPGIREAVDNNLVGLVDSRPAERTDTLAEDIHTQEAAYHIVIAVVSQVVAGVH